MLPNGDSNGRCMLGNNNIVESGEDSEGRSQIHSRDGDDRQEEIRGENNWATPRDEGRL